MQDDPRLLANFGILCYWLLFIESSELRTKFKREDDAEDDNDDEELDADGTMDEKPNDDVDRDDRGGCNGRYSDGDGVDNDDDVAPSSGWTNRKRPRRQPSSPASFNQWTHNTMTPQTVESLVESRYAFKASIGVHILYQEAAAALRRAVSVCPSSAQFTEFYVQVLTLAGDVDTACDYLENFYHLNPSDPHACRMVRQSAGPGK